VAKIRSTVVSNSTPLIYLAKVGRLRLIRDVYGKVWIPVAVFDEMVTRGKALQIADASVIEMAVGDWIIKEEIRPQIASSYRFLDHDERLGRGEREALKLCKQLNADFLIADDKEARRVATILNIKPIGTCGVLIEASKRGLISAKEIEETLHSLIKVQFRIAPDLYRRILREVGLIS